MVNFGGTAISSNVMDVGSFSRGGKCGVLGWDLFRAKPSGLNLEAQFTPSLAQALTEEACLNPASRSRRFAGLNITGSVSPVQLT